MLICLNIQKFTHATHASENILPVYLFFYKQSFIRNTLVTLQLLYQTQFQ